MKTYYLFSFFIIIVLFTFLKNNSFIISGLLFIYKTYDPLFFVCYLLYLLLFNSFCSSKVKFKYQPH